MILREPDLVRWGERIGRECGPSVFVCLRGPLGAGKSVLARAIARGAGVEGPIPSPTFNLVFRYPATRGEVVHMDLYRIRDAAELDELGWGDLGRDHEIALIEWPERAGDRLPPDRWEIQLESVEGQAALRSVTARRVGAPAPLPPFPMALSRKGR